MKDVFERTDKYKDYILKRSDLLMALRTDDLVVDFVDGLWELVGDAVAAESTDSGDVVC